MKKKHTWLRCAYRIFHYDRRCEKQNCRNQSCNNRLCLIRWFQIYQICNRFRTDHIISSGDARGSVSFWSGGWNNYSLFSIRLVKIYIRKNTIILLRIDRRKVKKKKNSPYDQSGHHRADSRQDDDLSRIRHEVGNGWHAIATENQKKNIFSKKNKS